jgi:hypothetical protein
MPTTVSRSTDRFLRPWAPHTPPEAHILALAYQLRRGKAFERALTKRERLLIALTSAAPTAFVTLDSAALSRREATKAWDLLIKRLKRNLHTAHPPIYLAVPARHSAQTAGYHIHALLWGYMHRPTLAKHARLVGFGPQPWFARVPAPSEDPDDHIEVLSYVLGQDQAVFGTRVHERHAPAERSAWGLLHPHAKTLQQHCPQLLTALTNAKSPQVSDRMLAERSPLFTTDIGVTSRSLRSSRDTEGHG